MRAALILALVAGCATFPDPQIVVDLRVLAIVAQPPEALIEVNPDHSLPDPAELIAEVDRQKPTVCATIADPGKSRAVHWSAQLCRLGDDDRCDPAAPTVELASGNMADPDAASMPAPLVDQVCVTVNIAENAVALGQIVQVELAANPTDALGGIPYGVEFRFRGAGDPEAEDIFAAKRVMITPDLPVGRTPNQNPAMDALQWSVDGSIFTPVQTGTQCDGVETDASISVDANEVVTLYPIEHAGSREMYFAPTLDGAFQTVTETLTYQWLGSDGSFSDETTGGGHDPFGNEKLLGTQWSPPHRDTIDFVQIWVVQRDERGGAFVFPTCIVVYPVQ